MDKRETWLLSEKYDSERSGGFFSDCKRLAAGEPLAYVIGFVNFLDCKIHLDSRPLIPRPETEHWTEKLIKVLQQSKADTPLKILDLGAGSGCIGIALAKNLPQTHVTFGELVADHLPTIFKNLEENKIDCVRYKVFASDLFANITGKFDVIVSNPPYIDAKLNRVEEAVRIFEPKTALYGGHYGMEIIDKIVTAASTYLNPHGQLWIEHEPEQVAAINEAAQKQGFCAASHTDQYGVLRYSVLVLQ